MLLEGVVLRSQFHALLNPFHSAVPDKVTDVLHGAMSIFISLTYMQHLIDFPLYSFLKQFLDFWDTTLFLFNSY